MISNNEHDRLRQLLEWQVAMGADEAVGTDAVDRFSEVSEAPPPKAEPVRRSQTVPAKPVVSPASPAAAPATQNAAVDARKLSAACNSIEDLMAALSEFDTCPLKRTATNLCVYDGSPKARVMLVGEAPGRDEDLQGKPFVGASGQLLDKMLAAIGLSRHAEDPRDSVFISNAVFWRPPGNRKPTEAETLMCLPFLHRLMELVQPEFIVGLGAVPVQRLTGQTRGITAVRGRWFAVKVGETETPLLATFHPSFLLRQSPQKREAWRDMLQLRNRLDDDST